MSFIGKVVVITGASSGIGAETSVAFAKEGASLALIARSIENLEKTKENCISAASSGTPAPLLITADVTKESDIERIIQETVGKFGKIDILVNNAGVARFHTIENFSLTDYDYIMNTNVRSVYHLTKLAIPYLEKTQGNIVNISSISGTRSGAGANTYCASKAALDHFSRCSALELGPKKIRVNVVSPGLVVTNFHKAGGLDDESRRQMIERAKEGYPLGRPAYPEEIADAILFLASEKAKFITGVVLPVDGGKSCVTTR